MQKPDIEEICDSKQKASKTQNIYGNGEN